MIDKIRKKYPKVKSFLAYAGYRGTTVEYAKSMGCTLHISRKIKYEFAIQPFRWIVERNIAWINNYRRLSKDYEANPLYSGNYINISIIRSGLVSC